MTGLAYISRINVCGTLTGCCRTIMTGYAGAIHLCVVHGDNWFPGGGVMTGLTDICRVDM